MTTWFTADLHLGHRNIIDYCSRPFADVEAMNEALIERWNELVAADDTVWVVGDFALGKIADTLPLIDLLHGRKVLVAGNHDRCWAGHGRRSGGWTERYLDAGFDEVRQGSTRIDIDATSVVVCHFPYRGDSQQRDRFIEHRPIDKGDWLLHGHVHDRWIQNGRMINVGVDATTYRPIGSGIIADMIRSGPNVLANLPTEGGGDADRAGPYPGATSADPTPLRFE